MNFALVLRAGSAVPLRFEDPSVMMFSDSPVPVDWDFLDSPLRPRSVGTTLQGSFLTPVPEPSELFSLGVYSVVLLRRRRSVEKKSSLEIDPWQKRKH